MVNVKSHRRITKSGKITTVKQHSRNITKKDAKLIANYMRELMDDFVDNTSEDAVTLPNRKEMEAIRKLEKIGNVKNGIGVYEPEEVRYERLEAE